MKPKQNKDLAKIEKVPEPAATYERTDGETVKNRQQTSEQARPAPLPSTDGVEHSMHDEEPNGWDLAPQDISDPEQKRHPRPDGLGGSERESTTKLRRPKR